MTASIEDSPAPSRRRGRVLAWCLYDFANSTYSAAILATFYLIYYTTEVVGNTEGRGDFWWGTVAIPISTIGVALTSPIMGAIADLSRTRRLLLATYTGVAVTAVALFTTVEKNDVLWGCLLFIIANFATEGAIVFYNAYLPEIVSADRLGRVSAWGFAVGYVGSVVALLGGVFLHGRLGYDAVWLMVAALFGGFALPAILVLGPGGKSTMAPLAAARYGWTHVSVLVREVLSLRDMRRFLGAYFIYMNGVNTAIFFAGSFAKSTMGLGDAQVGVLFILVQASALVGALVMAKPTDVLGPKRVVQLALGVWILAVAALVATTNLTTFYGACVVAGLGLGTVQAASRAFMATLIPRGREDEFFGFYALCGKSSAPLGSGLFGLISLALAGQQRVAVAAISVFFVAGLALLARVRAGGPTAARVAA